jgi:1-pyrroline-5-carboxylate dehydrogenase
MRATMLNQSKTPHQSEIDAVCESIDFLRFNVHFAEKIYREQPLVTGRHMESDGLPSVGRIRFSRLTPFNFTSIAMNLPSASSVCWATLSFGKCASSTVYSNYGMAKVFEEAGLPPGVINFIPGDAKTISDVVLSHSDFAGIHFTGSTAVFRGMWLKTGENIASYKNYPRIVGRPGVKTSPCSCERRC